jgi:hypothetical protein
VTFVSIANVGRSCTLTASSYGDCSDEAVKTLRRGMSLSNFGSVRAPSGCCTHLATDPTDASLARSAIFRPAASFGSRRSTEGLRSIELPWLSSQGCGSVMGTPSPSRTAHSEAPNGGSFWQQKAGTPVGSLLRADCKSQPAHRAPGISGDQAVQAQRNKQATHTNTKRSNTP